MKKLIAMALCILICFTFGCDKKVVDNEQTVMLYFLDENKENMVTEERSVPENTKDKLRFAIESLIEGPVDEKNVRALPEDVKILKLSVADGVATVDLSKNFNRGTKIEKLWSRYTLINTVCSIENIEKAKILVNGEEITSVSTDKVLGAMGKEDIVTDITQVSVDTTTVTLYFSDENAMKLVPETREIYNKEGQNLEKTLIEELLKGPQSKGLYSALPEGVKVLSTETKDGVCFVNLSAEFSSAGMGSSMETLSVYSVVNTLCAYGKIDKVQILVEGKKVDGFGHMNLAESLEKNEDILK